MSLREIASFSSGFRKGFLGIPLKEKRKKKKKKRKEIKHSWEEE